MLSPRGGGKGGTIRLVKKSKEHQIMMFIMIHSFTKNKVVHVECI